MNPDATVAVVLARGLGSRMRRGEPPPGLDPEQHRAAATGLKCLVPDSRGRPFLDHILAGLALAAVTRVILVVAPEHDAIARAARDGAPAGLHTAFAVQLEPNGTADAVLAARELVGRAPFLVLNADNLYPVEAIEALVALGGPGLVAFERDGLIEEGNIEAARVGAFAVLEVDPTGHLDRIVEKPGAAADALDADALVSMNLWRFDERIFQACAAVPISPRGERELPQAVALAVRSGARFRVVHLRAGVLDLSHPSDIAPVAGLLGARALPT
jgi:glucose-1-phosphate thymidylyltransferase